MKIEQISGTESVFEHTARPFLKDSRILFEYTDNAQELCIRKR
jgi:hypothetical protein